MLREIYDYVAPRRRITVDSLLQETERTDLYSDVPDFDNKLQEMRQEAWDSNISLTE